MNIYTAGAAQLTSSGTMHRSTNPQGPFDYHHKATPPPSYRHASAMLTRGFRGYCLYKTGKCVNERAKKTNGQAHNLCDVHRLKQNQNQRRMDSKMRHRKDFIYDVPARGHYSTIQVPCSQDSPYPTAFQPSNTCTSNQHAQYWTPREHGDVITIPTPSFLQGEAMEAFRSRVLQRVVNIISEEVTAAPYASEYQYQQYYESLHAQNQRYESPRSQDGELRLQNNLSHSRNHSISPSFAHSSHTLPPLQQTSPPKTHTRVNLPPFPLLHERKAI